jgi:hypothetical protein
MSGSGTQEEIVCLDSSDDDKSCDGGLTSTMRVSTASVSPSSFDSDPFQHNKNLSNDQGAAVCARQHNKDQDGKQLPAGPEMVSKIKIESESKPTVKRNRWSRKELDKLDDLMKKHGEDWEKIQTHLPGRSASSCRIACVRYLEHELTTEEEEENWCSEWTQEQKWSFRKFVGFSFRPGNTKPKFLSPACCWFSFL